MAGGSSCVYSLGPITVRSGAVLGCARASPSSVTRTTASSTSYWAEPPSSCNTRTTSMDGGVSFERQASMFGIRARDCGYTNVLGEERAPL